MIRRFFCSHCVDYLFANGAVSNSISYTRSCPDCGEVVEGHCRFWRDDVHD